MPLLTLWFGSKCLHCDYLNYKFQLFKLLVGIIHYSFRPKATVYPYMNQLLLFPSAPHSFSIYALVFSVFLFH